LHAVWARRRAFGWKASLRVRAFSRAALWVIRRLTKANLMLLVVCLLSGGPLFRVAGWCRLLAHSCRCVGELASWLAGWLASELAGPRECEWECKGERRRRGRGSGDERRVVQMSAEEQRRLTAENKFNFTHARTQYDWRPHRPTGSQAGPQPRRLGRLVSFGSKFVKC